MTAPLETPKLVATDLEALEQRARELASGSAGEDAEAIQERLVSFRLRGRPCAVDARVVERAVSRLARPLAVPLQEGGQRLVAFVEEMPVPVVDLEAFAGGAARDAGALEAHPALLIRTELGPVAVAVEGPLELLEDHIAFAVAGGDPAPLRTIGVLSGGTVALDPSWLQGWAEKAARP